MGSPLVPIEGSNGLVQGAFTDAVDVAFMRLSASEPSIRKAGAQSLAALAPLARVKTIQVCLAAETSPNVIKWLALALANIGDPASIPVLTSQLATTDDSDARDWVQLAIDTLSGRRTTKRVRSLLTSTEPEAALEAARLAWNYAALSKQDLRKLLALLDHPDPHVRRWAILALGSSRQLTDPAPFHDALLDDDFRVREWSEWTLAQIADEDSFAHLMPRIRDEHPRVREWAIKAIAALSADEIPVLISTHFLAELDPLCREAAVLSVLKWSGSTVVRQFISEVIEREAHPVVLAAAIRLVLSSTLQDDRGLMRQLIDKVRASDSGLLAGELQSNLIEALTPDEQNTLVTVMDSPRLPALLSIVPSLRRLHTQAPSKRKRAVGVVIALSEEFREFKSALAALDVELSPIAGALAHYEFRTPGLSHGDGHCVATLIGDMGPTRAALVTQELLSMFTLDTVISIGISAGIHEDLRVGDVVVARQVDDYLQHAKAVDVKGGDFAFVLSGDPFKTDSNYQRQVANFEFAHGASHVEWAELCGEDLQRTLSAVDLHRLVTLGLVRERPRIALVNMASSSVVAGGRAFCEWLQGHDRNYKAVDMEASGVALAVHFGGLPVRTLMLRGVSDFGDRRKKRLDRLGQGALRALAMRNAVQFLMRFVTVAK